MCPKYRRVLMIMIIMMMMIMMMTHRRAEAPSFTTLAELEELMAWGLNIVKDPDGVYYPDGPGTESYWAPYRY